MKLMFTYKNKKFSKSIMLLGEVLY